MQISKRRAWIIVFIFCVLVWALIFASLVYASVGSEKEPPKRVEQDANKLAENVRKLDLNEKQRKFIESLIEYNEKKQ